MVTKDPLHSCVNAQVMYFLSKLYCSFVSTIHSILDSFHALHITQLAFHQIYLLSMSSHVAVFGVVMCLVVEKSIIGVTVDIKNLG